MQKPSPKDDEVTLRPVIDHPSLQLRGISSKPILPLTKEGRIEDSRPKLTSNVRSVPIRNKIPNHQDLN